MNAKQLSRVTFELFDEIYLNLKNFTFDILKIFNLGCNFLKMNRLYDNQMTATQFYVYYRILMVIFIVKPIYYSAIYQ